LELVTEGLDLLNFSGAISLKTLLRELKALPPRLGRLS